MRRYHQSASMCASGSLSSSRREISDRGLHSALPMGRPRLSRTATAPGSAFGGSMTSLRKIHGCPAAQRWAPRAETVAEAITKAISQSKSHQPSAYQAHARNGGGLAWRTEVRRKPGYLRRHKPCSVGRIDVLFAPFRNRSPLGGVDCSGKSCVPSRLTTGDDKVRIRSFSAKLLNRGRCLKRE